MWLKRTLVFLFVFLLVFHFPTVSAQDATSPATPSKTLRQGLHEKTQNRQENIQEKIQALRDELQQQRKKARELFREKREEFKTRLQELKDVRKKTLVERIDTRITTMNTNRTNHFLDVLERLEVILDRIRDKAETAKTNGKDTSELEAAITAASDALSLARSAVAAQAGKEYIIDASSEAGLKNNVGKIISQLRIDLSSTHKAVINAKQAVRKAATELAKLVSAKGINNPLSATGSGGTE